MADSRKKQIRREQGILLGLFLVLAVGFAVYTGYIYHFNHLTRTCAQGEKNDCFTVEIAPRTGKTDSWVKRIDENGGTSEYYGTIYDIAVKNTGRYEISGWNLSLDIPQDCYLNNAWCGTVDVHQNGSQGEKTQTLNLRDYEIADLKLNYRMENPDLMIPLTQGDYLVYHPDVVSGEYPIFAGDDNKMTSVVFGVIFYTTEEKSLVFPNYQVQYTLRKNYSEGWAFGLLSMGSFAWVILLFVFISVEWNMRAARDRFRQDERIIQQSIGVFTHFFEAKDIYTTGHSQRVAEYSRLVAEKLGLSEDECRHVYYIGLMHDCGKCYIPDEILKKPGALTKEEYEVIKSHTVKGAEMLKGFTSIENIRDGVLYHHERYDGKGYPEGLAGENIPLISRIICISDSFDAMNSRRCYRDLLSQAHILSELKNGSGKQFDPKLVPIFLSLLKEDAIRFHADGAVQKA